VFPGRGAQVIDCDICVYGATSGGVSAAVAAARLGKNVVLVTYNNHVGGMTSGGLGVTDIGGTNTAYIGGISAEFYSRVGQAYGSTNPVYWFEPHVAEQTFWQMLSEAGVPVYTNLLLASVTMSNQAITQITMNDGTTYQAREFIDTTYEGDLMALAGVTFTVGREGTNTYGESLAGVETPGGSYNYDPYVIAGNTNSGLLPLVQPGGPGTVGQGDNKVQTYNFRLCLTQNPTNQIPIAPPANYSESQYELFRRYIAARVAQDGSVNLDQLINIQTLIPNGKTDINADGELSTDYVGYNYTYPTNTYAGRAVIWQAHEDYIRGQLYFFATSTNVPLNVRTQMQSWGLAADEFQDTGGWPHQMYVREARRMVSDYVMLQQDALGGRSASDPIALGNYPLDSHPVARLAVDGYARWEGGAISGTPPYPFGISYRSIIPSTNQCQNLFCTFALSASHVGFAPVRMEPVFMMTSQSAGTAAAFAMDDNVSVQQLNYQKLSAELLADGQILTWTNGQIITTNGIILTVTNSAGVTASTGWSAGSNPGGWPLPNGAYWTDGNSGKGAKWVSYTPTLPASGTYQVYAWWVASSPAYRDAHVPIDIVYPGGTNRVYVNQQANGSAWNLLLTTNFNAGTQGTVTIRNNGTTNYVVANAVQFLPVGNGATSAPPVDIVASDAVAGEFGANTARFTVVCPNGANASPLTVNYSVSGTAISGVDYAPLPGRITIPAGALATNIVITPLGSNLPTNQATVTLTLVPSANFTATSLSNATIVILDRPINVWRRANFTPAELADPSISGDLADPEHDGLSNLMKYALGLPPKAPVTTNRPCAGVATGYLTLTYTHANAAADVSLTVEQSNDLVAWHSGTNYVQQLSVVDQGSNQLITVQTLAPVGSSAASFVQLRATRLP
jgi:hypothetical protein